MKELSKLVENYEDVFYCLRDPKMEQIRELYCAHVLNHALKYEAHILNNFVGLASLS